jgi:molybdate transport system substrate-binding protein
LADSHGPIVYPFAVTKSGDTADAHALMSFLAEPQAGMVFEQRGFKINEPDGK